MTQAAAFQHLTADFHGVAAAQLRDEQLVAGLVIAAAGAAGMGSFGMPTMRHLSHGGVVGLLLVDGCHIVVHTVPESGLLLLDVLATAAHDARKALDVFARRLPAREVKSEIRARG